MEGYIKIWRKIMDDTIYTNSHILHMALHLILIANFKDRIIVINNQQFLVKRGQSVIGREKLAESLGMSVQVVRSSLISLSNLGFITINSTNRFSIITVVKYEDYQGNNQQSIQPDNQQITNKQPTNNQQITTPNKDKKDKNEEKVKVFVPPSEEEVIEYSKSIGFQNLDLDAFFGHYTGNGWRQGKGEGRPLKSWKGAVRTWKSNAKRSGTLVDTINDADRAKELEERAARLFEKGAKCQ